MKACKLLTRGHIIYLRSLGCNFAATQIFCWAASEQKGVLGQTIDLHGRKVARVSLIWPHGWNFTVAIESEDDNKFSAINIFS
jgi:hypothetical protein